MTGKERAFHFPSSLSFFYLWGAPKRGREQLSFSFPQPSFSTMKGPLPSSHPANRGSFIFRENKGRPPPFPIPPLCLRRRTSDLSFKANSSRDRGKEAGNPLSLSLSLSLFDFDLATAFCCLEEKRAECHRWASVEYCLLESQIKAIRPLFSDSGKKSKTVAFYMFFLKKEDRDAHPCRMGRRKETPR